MGFCCHNPCRLQAILRFTRLVVQPDLGGIKATRDNGMFFWVKQRIKSWGGWGVSSSAGPALLPPELCLDGSLRSGDSRVGEIQASRKTSERGGEIWRRWGLGSREDIFLIFSFFYNVTTSLLSPARVSLSRSLFLGFSLIPVVVVGVVSSLFGLCLSGLTSLCLCLCPVCVSDKLVRSTLSVTTWFFILIFFFTWVCIWVA